MHPLLSFSRMEACMADQVSFKARVLNTIIQCAKQYNTFYVERNHLLVSDAFKKKPYYITKGGHPHPKREASF